MVLSDVDIIEAIGRGDLRIDPYDESNVEPASVDLRLGSEFQKGNPPSNAGHISLSDVDDCIEWDEQQNSIILRPGDFVLASTKETITIPENLVAHVLGRSSLGRLGVSVHQTAGYIDPGFEGQITLELSNHGPAPVRLAAGDRICQIVFEELSSPALNPYGHDSSQYQNQTGPTPSGMQFD